MARDHEWIEMRGERVGMQLDYYLAYKERVEESVADECVNDRIDAESRAEIVPINSVATSRRLIGTFIIRTPEK